MAAPHWQTRRFLIDLSSPQVMGIVNVTPDSFSDGGRYSDLSAACAHCDRLLTEGAQILDIGGESTRPGCATPSWQEELARVLPVVRHAVTLGVPVSVDTSRPEVISEVLSAGADIINDIRALSWPGALQAVAEDAACGICLMHMQGQPATMQQAPHYEDLLGEISSFLRQRLAEVLAQGITAGRIVLDPGYGFGKTAEHNWALLNQQARLMALGYPLLAGLSRKGMLGQVTGRPVGERVIASVAAALAAVSQGARIVRVHDVAATVDGLRVWAAAGLLPPAG